MNCLSRAGSVWRVNATQARAEWLIVEQAVSPYRIFLRGLPL